MLKRAHLPPLCNETDPNPSLKSSKYHARSSLCLGQLHPLEVLCKLADIEESARPMILLTNPGEALVLPERWMHMTVNLDETFTVSYRFERSYPYVLGCFKKTAGRSKNMTARANILLDQVNTKESEKSLEIGEDHRLLNLYPGLPRQEEAADEL
jgi:hypothetical protein